VICPRNSFTGRRCRVRAVGWRLAADRLSMTWRQCWKQLAARSVWLFGPFAGAIPVISFGAGDGSTDRLLLDPVRQSGPRAEILSRGCQSGVARNGLRRRVEDLDIETTGIKADISSPMHLVFACGRRRVSQVAPDGRQVRWRVRSGGSRTADGAMLARGATGWRWTPEIYQGNGTTPHESDAMRQFTFAPLAGLGVSAEEGEVRLEHKRDERLTGLYVTRAYFRPDRDMRIPVAVRTCCCNAASAL